MHKYLILTMRTMLGLLILSRILYQETKSKVILMHQNNFTFLRVYSKIEV